MPVSAKGDILVRMRLAMGEFQAGMRDMRSATRGLEKDIARMGETSQAASARQARRMQQALRHIGAATLAATGLGSVMQTFATFASVVRKEFQAMRSLGQQAGTTQISAAEGLMRASLMTELPPAQIEAWMKRHAGVTVPITDVLSSLGPAFSAAESQGIDPRIAMNIALRVQERMTTAQPMEARSATIEAVLASISAWATPEQREALMNLETPEEVDKWFGAVMGAQRASRVIDPGAFSKNIMSRAVQLPALFPETSFESATELLNAMTATIQGGVGRAEATAVSNALTDIFEEMASQGLEEEDAKEAMRKIAFATPGSREEKIKAKLLGIVGARAGLSDEIVRDMRRGRLPTQTTIRREARSFGGLVSMFDPNGRFWTEVMPQVERLTRPPGEEAASVQNELIRQVRETDVGRTFMVARTLEGSVRKGELADRRGLTFAAVPSLKKILLRAGRSAVGADVETTLLELQAMGATGQTEQLEQIMESIRERRREIRERPEMQQAFFTRGAGRRVPHTPVEEETMVRLTEVLDELRPILESLRESADGKVPLSVKIDPATGDARYVEKTESATLEQ